MANTLGIAERTLAQVSSSVNSINVVNGTDGRKSVYQPLLVRITDHDDNVGAEIGDDTDRMAIFESKRHGEPWKKDGNVLKHIVHNANDGASGSDVSVLLPDFDYSTFE